MSRKGDARAQDSARTVDRRRAEYHARAPEAYQAYKAAIERRDGRGIRISDAPVWAQRLYLAGA